MASGVMRLVLSLSSERNFNFKNYRNTSSLEYSKYLIFRYAPPKSAEMPVRDRVAFSMPHLFSLKNGFDEAAAVIADPETFITYTDGDEERLKVSDSVSQFFVRLIGAGKSMIIRPDTRTNDMTLTEEGGATLIIGSKECRAFISRDTFLSLAMVVSDLNLHGSAQSLLCSYLSSKRNSYRPTSVVIEE